MATLGKPAAIKTFNAAADPQPSKVHLRPTWFMRILARSLRHGDWVTPRVYMARAVWEQSDARVVALPAKVACCRRLLQQISMLDQEDKKYVAGMAQLYAAGDFPPAGTLQAADFKDAQTQLLKKLDDVCAVCVDMQMELSRYLSFVTAPVAMKESMASSIFGKMRVLGDKISGSEKTASGSYTEYLCLLCDICDKSQLLERWMTSFEQENTDVMDRLLRISSFLFNVVCEWIVRDCSSLLEQYVTSKESALRRLY